jgi:hypothetical protein
MYATIFILGGDARQIQAGLSTTSSFAIAAPPPSLSVTSEYLSGTVSPASAVRAIVSTHFSNQPKHQPPTSRKRLDRKFGYVASANAVLDELKAKQAAKQTRKKTTKQTTKQAAKTVPAIAVPTIITPSPTVASAPMVYID